MDANTTINHLYYFLVLATKVPNIAGDCKIGSKVTSIRYSETILNHTLVGPVLSSITAINERECEKECHLAVPNICYMFNYYPSSKVCELLYKDRAAEYKVKKKKGSTFKTRKCDPDVCKDRGQCYSLGDQNNNFCLCKPAFSGKYCHIAQNGIKTNTVPVCIGAKDNGYGTFFAPVDGEIKTFKLVHVSGGVNAYHPVYKKGNWGSLGEPHLSRLELHITDHQDSRISPPPSYPMLSNSSLTYNIPGFNAMSPELVFPEISPPLAVTKGKEFRIWFGGDLRNHFEHDNAGTTCADVYAYYTK